MTKLKIGKCIYCQKECRYDFINKYFICENHPIKIHYIFEHNDDEKGYHLEYFTFQSKYSKNNFNAKFYPKLNKFSLYQQFSNESLMKEVLTLDFLPELTPDNILDKIKTYLTFL